LQWEAIAANETFVRGRYSYDAAMLLGRLHEETRDDRKEGAQLTFPKGPGAAGELHVLVQDLLAGRRAPAVPTPAAPSDPAPDEAWEDPADEGESAQLPELTTTVPDLFLCVCRDGRCVDPRHRPGGAEVESADVQTLFTLEDELDEVHLTHKRTCESTRKQRREREHGVAAECGGLGRRARRERGKGSPNPSPNWNRERNFCLERAGGVGQDGRRTVQAGSKSTAGLGKCRSRTAESLCCRGPRS
jgi:hypothetical protein